MKVIRDGVEVEVTRKDMTAAEVRAYNTAAARRSRAAKKEAQEEAERSASPTLAEMLRKANPKDPASDEQLVAQWLAVHQPEAERLYFERCLRVHRDIARKLEIPDVQPGETLYSFTRRVAAAANEDSPDAQIVWNVPIPDRPLEVK